MATKTLTCTEDVSISQKYPSRAYNEANRLAFGAGESDSTDKYYALLKFSDLELPSASYRITGATLTLTKISGAIGYNASFSAKAVRITSSWSESTNWSSRPSTTTTGQSAAVSVGSGHSGSFSLDVTEIVKAWQDSAAYGIQIEKTTSGGSLLKCICDRTGSSMPTITVTYEQVLPNPTSPIVSAIGTVTGANATFSWQKSTDTVFAQSQLAYELQVSDNSGSSWSGTYTTADNADSYTVDVSSAFGIATTRYYYNPNLRVRVRAKTPSFNGTVYYSAWAEATGAIDYRRGLGTPALGISDADIHEGGSLTLTFSRPDTYNLYQSNGSVNRITYTARLGNGNAFASVTSDASNASASVTVSVPALTTGRNDYSTTLFCNAVDINGQTSGNSGSTSFIIRRHQAPTVNVTNINRADTSATVTFRVTDTGYATQDISVMQTSIQYRLNGGSYTTITPSWSGLTATFTISGLSASYRYTLDILVRNVASEETAAKQTVYTLTITELVPAAFIFSDTARGTQGIAAKSLIVSADYTRAPEQGEGMIDKISAGEFGFIGASSSAGLHNSIYRGKALGDIVTAAQWASIAAGTFDDLWIGDYWTIGGVNWRIAAFDYYLTTGDTACNTHHAVIVPDSPLYTYVMNDTLTSAGGYVGSKMRTSGLAQALTTINAAFGSSHILSHRQYLCNDVTNGYPSGCSWYDSKVELMTEQNVYGGKVMTPMGDGTTVVANYTIDKSQYPLFAHDPHTISNRVQFWLRDVASALTFTYVSYGGTADYYGANAAYGVRPAFSIK